MMATVGDAGPRLRGWLPPWAARALTGPSLMCTVAVLVLHPLPADASFNTQGVGAGTATVGTLNAPTSVTVTSLGSTVTVNWTGATPPVGTLDGYTVTRYAGATPSNACGTDPANSATFIPAGTTTCSDTSVPDGTYSYTVTAVFRTWTAQSLQSNAQTVVGDQTKPTQSVTEAAGASNAHLVGTTLFYRSTASGSFGLVDTVTAVLGPASATFPAIAATGWTHPAQTVSTGTGTNPIAYTSSTYSWTASPGVPATHTVVGRDSVGNTVNEALTFASDTTGPTGGVLSVNATTASGAGTTSYANASFPVTVRTDYAADAGAGQGTSVLTREPATLINNACGTFGAAVTLTGAPLQSGLTTGCYRYTLTGTDIIGNTSAISTTVVYDVGLPTQAITMTAGVNSAQTGNVVYYRTTTGGSFTLNDAVTDGDTGPASATFPAIGTAGWTHNAETVLTGTGAAPTISYPSTSYSFTTVAAAPVAQSVVGKDVAGNSVTTPVTLTKDIVVPVSGAVKVNAIAATTAVSASYAKTASLAISARVDYTDALSGIASSVLTVASATLSANTCGAYGSTTTIAVGVATQAVTTGCWKFVLTGTDRVGNVASIATVVKVDLLPLTGGALTVNGLAATAAATTGTPTNVASFPIDLRTDWTDAESGMKTSTLTRAPAATWSAGNCGSYAAATTIVGTPVQTGLVTSCYKYVLTGTDNALNVTTITTIVKYDITPPTAGALTVNGVGASAAGTSSTANAASFTIGLRTPNTDVASGLASTILTRQPAPLSGSTCGSYGAATTIVGTAVQTGLATGCYLYTLTGTDLAGNTVAISTTVKLGVYVTNVAMTNGTGTLGRIDQGDRVVVTFSDQIDVSTLCSTWTDSTLDQAISGDNEVTVTLNNLAGSDTLTVSSSTCTLNFGTLSLGSTAYTTGTVTFGGALTNKSTVGWSVSSRQLTITLGQVSAAGPAVVATSIATYTPLAAVLSTVGVATGGTFVSPNVKQF